VHALQEMMRYSWTRV